MVRIRIHTTSPHLSQVTFVPSSGLELVVVPSLITIDATWNRSRLVNRKAIEQITTASVARPPRRLPTRTLAVLLLSLLAMSLLLTVLPSTASRSADWHPRRRARTDGDAWWCDAHLNMRRCTSSGCQDADASCRPLLGGTNAILLSDRLARATEVTLRSLCSFDPIELVFVSVQPQPNAPPQFGACRLVPVLARDLVVALEGRGFLPRRVCTLDGSVAALTSGPAALHAKSHHIKHAMCLNHLRFYLAELPMFSSSSRLVLLDDDIVLRKSLRALVELPLQPSSLLAANCETFAWSPPCVGWAVSAENYSAWFARNEHGMRTSDWGLLRMALREPPQLSHHTWNFGCTLLNLVLHRQLGVAQHFETVASRLLADQTLRPDTLLYGLGLPYLVCAWARVQPIPRV